MCLSFWIINFYHLKKTASIFLLIIFLFNVAGFFGLFSYLKQENYKSVFSRDAKELNLVRLTIPKTETLHWEKENEIIYHGKYFDVFSKSEDGKNYFLLCYSDSRDNFLCDAFSKHVRSQTENASEKNSNSNHQVKIIIQDFILHSFVWKIQNSIGERASSQISFSLPSGFTSVFSPPPEFIAGWHSLFNVLSNNCSNKVDCSILFSCWENQRWFNFNFILIKLHYEKTYLHIIISLRIFIHVRSEKY